ncbi:MAG: shikimate kinase AroK [Gammaproteobacteria bacterium]|nr:shikimate kinase AroK [Gammaproteobacteria bacterium]
MNKGGNLFLIGPMGSGKTTIGRQLAAILHKRFVDADHEIERRTGVSIPTIFDIEGEEGFRNREAAVIEDLSRDQDLVLATGGGAVLREENRTALKSRGTVIYLQADVDTLVERTRRDRNRPLLQTADPRGKIEQLLRERESAYLELADIIVETGQRAPASVARDVIAHLKQATKNENPEG